MTGIVSRVPVMRRVWRDQASTTVSCLQVHARPLLVASGISNTGEVRNHCKRRNKKNISTAIQYKERYHR